MRVLVCGSRTFDDEDIVRYVLDGLYDHHRDQTIIEGGASGADAIAARLADETPLVVRHEQYPADWDKHGPAAGPIRNQRMLNEAKPDIVLAFVDKPLAQSFGTADMVCRARSAGVKTYVIEKVR